MSDEEQEFIDKSPKGNYGKYKKLIGKGAFKRVYKAQDLEHGNLVAWNEVNIASYTSKERKRILNEVTLLRKLEHKNLIRFFGAWINKEKEQVIFVTELMSSGTLKEFRSKYPLSRRQIKEYCREILDCLDYLHCQDIIHRDLKCENIFVQGRSIKIGDLGLATIDGRSVIGTPEFMAPDMYESDYTKSVDIWAFGMCVLEMVTGLAPYHECRSIPQILRKVSEGQLPDALELLKLAWPECAQFVIRCLGKMVPVDSESEGHEATIPEEPEEDEDSTHSARESDEEDNKKEQESAAMTSGAVMASPETAHRPTVKTPDTDRRGRTSERETSPSSPSKVDRTQASRGGFSVSRYRYLRPEARVLKEDSFLDVTEEDRRITTEHMMENARKSGFDVPKSDDRTGIAAAAGPAVGAAAAAAIANAQAAKATGMDVVSPNASASGSKSTLPSATSRSPVKEAPRDTDQLYVSESSRQHEELRATTESPSERSTDRAPSDQGCFFRYDPFGTISAPPAVNSVVAFEVSETQ